MAYSTICFFIATEIHSNSNSNSSWLISICRSSRGGSASMCCRGFVNLFLYCICISSVWLHTFSVDMPCLHLDPPGDGFRVFGVGHGF